MPAEQSARGAGLLVEWLRCTRRSSFPDVSEPVWLAIGQGHTLAFGVRRLHKLLGIAPAIAGFVALAAVSPPRADLHHQYCRRLQPSLRAACLAQYNYDVSHHVPIGP
jgi:hypothetical protein